ncbi:MAG: hypothetical protein HYX38_14995 [Rhodospirillales bacterium]|nr:hypothetical protein [Rhodospirillales bacterium]
MAARFLPAACEARLRAAFVTCLTSLLLVAGALVPGSQAAVGQRAHSEALDGLSRLHDALLPAKLLSRVACDVRRGLPAIGGDTGGPIDLPDLLFHTWPIARGAVQECGAVPASGPGLLPGAHRPRGPPQEELEVRYAPSPLVLWTVPMPLGRLPALPG